MENASASGSRISREMLFFNAQKSRLCPFGQRRLLYRSARSEIISLRISQSENFNRNIRIALKNIDKLLGTQFDIGDRRYEQSGIVAHSYSRIFKKLSESRSIYLLQISVFRDTFCVFFIIRKHSRNFLRDRSADILRSGRIKSFYSSSGCLT